MGKNFELSVNPESIAYITINQQDSKVNVLSDDMLKEFDQLLDHIESTEHVRAIVIKSGKEGVFIAGADIKQFDKAFKNPEIISDIIETGHRVFSRLQNFSVPTIALINGVCLGGGLELALACDYRICTDHPKCKLGLPEVNLGIFPGWGGTQRLPRLIGLKQGLTMILSGKPVQPKKAFKIGLIDRLVPYEFLQLQIHDLVEEIIENGVKRKDRASFWLEKNPLGRAVLFQQSRKNVLDKTKGFYPAPILALDLIKRTHPLKLEEGLKEEKRTFLNEVHDGFKNAIHLINVFLKMEGLKKQSVDEELVRTHKNLSVLGAGVMGSEIAWLATYNDYNVRLKDIKWEPISKGFQNIKKLYGKSIKKRKMTKDEVNIAMHRLSWSTDYVGFRHVDFVIEAATEDLELKDKIFEELENYVSSDAIVATNTSSLTVKEMSKVFKHPERFVGMHFFNPVHKMPLIEVVKGEKTSVEAVQTVIKLCQQLKKVPLVVKDCPGFLVNRIFAMQANEAIRLVEEGVPKEQVIKVYNDFGMPMEPFELADYVGNDTSYHAFSTFHQAYGKRMEIPKTLKEIVDQELYGKKTGEGFYLYENGEKKKWNPKMDKILSDLPSDPGFSDEEVLDRIILAMLAEAGRCLEEEIVEHPSDIDIALILGTGFPAYTGGLMAYANDRDLGYMVEKMEKYYEKYGERYQPCEYLRETEKEELELAKTL